MKWGEIGEAGLVLTYIKQNLSKGLFIIIITLFSLDIIVSPMTSIQPRTKQLSDLIMIASLD